MKGLHNTASRANRTWWRCAATLAACLVATGANAAVPQQKEASQKSCGAGWDQLLAPAQKEEAARERGCDVRLAAAPVPQAEQLAAYERTLLNGPSGALAAPAKLGKQRVDRRYRQTGPVTVRTSSSGAGAAVALSPLIDSAARAHDIDPLLLHAIARVESRHNTGAVSHAGARGVMQVIVPTAARFGVSSAQALHDPQVNLLVSARYLKTLQMRFNNRLPLVLAAYNAGEGAVERYGGRIPPYRETQGYVRQVLAEYALLRSLASQSAVPQ